MSEAITVVGVKSPRFAADAVLRARLARGLTLRELAAIAEVSKASIQAIETGLTRPNPATASKLARALELDPADLWLVAA